MRKALILAGVIGLTGFFGGGSYASECEEVEVGTIENVGETTEKTKKDIFEALKKYGFDGDFLKDKDIIVMESEDGKLFPRYISHTKENKNIFHIFDSGLMAAVSVVGFIVSTPLFYKLFHSQYYKGALGDMFAVICAIGSGGCVGYVSGKVAHEIIQGSFYKKDQPDQKDQAGPSC